MPMARIRAASVPAAPKFEQPPLQLAHAPVVHDVAPAPVAIQEQVGEFSMPEIGGKSLAAHIQVSLGTLKGEIDALRLDAGAALGELSTELANGRAGVKKIREETAAVKAAFADILGNEGAGSGG